MENQIRPTPTMPTTVRCPSRSEVRRSGTSTMDMEMSLRSPTKTVTVAARYEYDAWGLVTSMYNRNGERVREGMGWIGDLGSGNGSPGSLQGPEDGSGNTVPDYHPGNGKGNGQGQGKANG